jgi:hypothetical protein
MRLVMVRDEFTVLIDGGGPISVLNGGYLVERKPPEIGP